MKSWYEQKVKELYSAYNLAIEEGRPDDAEYLFSEYENYQKMVRMVQH